jgi:hypothetical protein
MAHSVHELGSGRGFPLPGPSAQRRPIALILGSNHITPPLVFHRAAEGKPEPVLEVRFIGRFGNQ